MFFSSRPALWIGLSFALLWGCASRAVAEE